ncbi:MAG: hypothetical protein AAF605_05560 [Myxococcota bacterium]
MVVALVWCAVLNAPSDLMLREAEDEEVRQQVDQPFAFHEILRADLRGDGLTRRSFVVTPAAPLPISGPAQASILFRYRNDVVDTVLLGSDGLHRFELGLPGAVELSQTLSLDVDLRAVYASDLNVDGEDSWYPWVRLGPIWSLSSSLSVGAALLYTRGALGLVPVPVGALYWRPAHRRYRLDILAPRYTEAAWSPSSGVEVYGAFHWETHAWAVRSSREGAPILLRQEIRTHAGVRIGLVGPLAVDFAIQWLPYQRLELDERAESSTNEVSLSASIVLDRLAL